MAGACRTDTDSTQLRQVVEELQLELASLVGRDGLWTPEARYPVVQ